MKNLLLVFTALLAISGIVSINLWRDLRTERQATAELGAQLAKAGRTPLMPAAPETAAQSIATPVPVPVPVPVPQAPVAAAKPATPPVESEVFARATAAAISAGAAAVAGGINDRDLLQDPEYRKAQLVQARMRMAQSNPGLAAALGISAREADHLFEAMAEAQLKLTDELMQRMAKAGNNTSAIAELTRTMAGRQDPARAALGEARYEQYQEYQRNVRPVLSKVATMGNTMNAAGQPLNDSQARAVAAVILTEQQRQQQDAATSPRSSAGVARNVADSLAEYQQTRDDNDRRLLQAATPHLNAAQIDALQKQIEQQAAQSRRMLETARGLDARRQARPEIKRDEQ